MTDLSTVSALHTSDPQLRRLNPRLNEGGMVEAIVADTGSNPVARFVNDEDVPFPPAPAWYLPGKADIYIHVDRAGIDTTRLSHHVTFGVSAEGHGLDAAKVAGLLAHEAGHAAISSGLVAAEVAAPHHANLLTLLEELRVENYAMRRVPASRAVLRASFTIILKGLDDAAPSDPAGLARAWALVRGRTLAGIATADETDALDSVARTLLTDDTVDELTDLLQEALTLTLPDDMARLIAICDAWTELVGEDGHDEGCAAGSADGTGAKGSGRPGAAKPSGGTAGLDKKVEVEIVEGGSAKAEKDDEPEADKPEKGAGAGGGDDEPEDDDEGDDGEPKAGSVSITPSIGTVGSGGGDTIDPESVELVKVILEELTVQMEDEWAVPEPSANRANAMEWGAKVFGHNRKPALTEVEPTTAHRQAVVRVSQQLSQLALPAVTKEARPAVLPPGRLRSREMVRGAAERAQGRMVTAKPWRGTVRRHSLARPLVLGIATDTSGSMAWAQRAVAEFAFVYANAGHRIGARTAAVTFGSRVVRICRPGEVMTKILVKPAVDSEEQCDYALAALDGVLHLTAPAYAARILIVVSDGALVRNGETGKVSEWLTEMCEAGTHVLWVMDHEAMSYSHYGFWLRELAKKLDNLTIVEAAKAKRHDQLPFESLEQAVADAIRKHIR